MDPNGGVHSGLTPDALCALSAMCPPSTSTVSRKLSFSTETARRLRCRISDMNCGAGPLPRSQPPGWLAQQKRAEPRGSAGPPGGAPRLLLPCRQRPHVAPLGSLNRSGNLLRALILAQRVHFFEEHFAILLHG